MLPEDHEEGDLNTKILKEFLKVSKGWPKYLALSIVMMILCALNHLAALKKKKKRQKGELLFCFTTTATAAKGALLSRILTSTYYNVGNAHTHICEKH